MNYRELQRHYIGEDCSRHERDDLEAHNIQVPSIMDSEPLIRNEDVDITTIMQLEGIVESA